MFGPEPAGDAATADLEAATTFATDYLGLEIAYRAKDAVYLKSDQREHTLCYFSGSPRDHTVAFEVSECSDLETAAASGRLARQVSVIAEGAGLDRKRLLQWVLAYAGLSAAWFIEDGADPIFDLTIAKIAAAELANN